LKWDGGRTPDSANGSDASFRVESQKLGKRMKILVIDVGGTHVKVRASSKELIKIPSGPAMTAGKMVAAVRKLIAGWQYDAVTIGYPGAVIHGRIVSEPHNLGGGWVGFDFRKSFRCPVRIMNDAAMQALGSYEGKRMLFLGLGTGLGAALIVDGILEPLELAHLPYKKGRTYEDYAGLTGLKRLGKRKWRRYVGEVVGQLKTALEADYVVLGGGNAKLLKTLPPGARLGDNANAFRGGQRLWAINPPLSGATIKTKTGVPSSRQIHGAKPLPRRRTKSTTSA
jgi:polyphosphate glucokinase